MSARTGSTDYRDRSCWPASARPPPPLVPVLLPGSSADDGEHAVCAWACWRVTGDGTAIAAAYLARAVARSPQYAVRALRMLADLGPAATSAETIRAGLADDSPHLRVEAARALWRATGSLDEALPVLLNTVRNADEPDWSGPLHIRAVQYLGQIGPPATDATCAIEALLHGDRRVAGIPDRDGGGFDLISWDQHVQQVASHALTQINRGHPPRDMPAGDLTAHHPFGASTALTDQTPEGDLAVSAASSPPDRDEPR